MGKLKEEKKKSKKNSPSLTHSLLLLKMEPPNENQFSSYYHPHPHHHQQQQQIQNAVAAAATAAAPTNGLLPNTHHHGPSEGTHMVYPHSVTSAVSTQLEPAKRKRGRPRKYGTAEQALAAKKATSSASKERNEQQGQGLGLGGASASSSSFSKKSQLDALALGHAGQGFTPHVINIVAGEDVTQKIILFVQQSKREICVLSASGSISYPSLRQPAISGGKISYEGQFEIISLSGSYIHNDHGGRNGGLSVCLSSTDGQIVGGVVDGPLEAAGPVQVIVGTFLINTKKDVGAGAKGDASANRLPSAVGGASISSLGVQSVESSGRNPIQGNDDTQTIGGSHFMIQPRGIHMTPARPTDWRSGPDARGNASYNLTGRIGYGRHQSPENGDYEHITD